MQMYVNFFDRFQRAITGSGQISKGGAVDSTYTSTRPRLTRRA